MDSKKTDLVIKYNLHWKNAPTSSAKNRVNIVGMYDLPASTRTLEKFKSYLLKNSGATADDVRVSYIGDDDKEFPIETQEDFQIALNYFREVARSGNTITLKLDRIFYKNKSRLSKQSSSSLDESSLMENEEAFEAEEQNHSVDEEAPQWFTKYMVEFKKEIIKEVSAAVVNALSETAACLIPVQKTEIKKKIKEKEKLVSSESSEVTPLVKKKSKTSKRLLKASGDNIASEKDALKERRLDLKLAKLENRTMKIKEKKAALQVKKDVDSNRSTSTPRPLEISRSEIENLMGAVPVGQHETTIPHMLGGEIFEQEWEVVNTGQLPWTTETELHYAWGSEALKPVNITYPCPNLKPGEVGVVKVQLEVPKKPGTYESYWHFHHIGRRFGHWLGCQVIVDPSPVKTQEKQSHVEASQMLPLPPINLAAHPRKLLETIVQERASVLSSPEQNKLTTDKNLDSKDVSDNLDKQEKENLKKDIQDLSSNLEDLSIRENEISNSSSSSDTDNQSIISITDSNTSSGSEAIEEYVMVAIPKEQEQENVQNVTQGSSEEDKNNNDEAEGSVQENNDRDYVKINDVIIPIPSVDDLKEEVSTTDANKEEIQKEAPSQSGSDEVLVAEKEETKKNVNVQELEEPKLINTEQKEKIDMSDYVYVTIDGEKLPVPKKFLRQDFLTKVESTSVPKSCSNVEKESQPEAAPSPPVPTSSASGSVYEYVQEVTVPNGCGDLENARNTQSIYISAATTPDISLCSLQDVSGSDDTKSVPSANFFRTNYPNNTRLFMFPQNGPGFEVLYTPYNADDGFGRCSNNSQQTTTSQSDSNATRNAWFSHYNSAGNSSSFYQADPSGNNQYTFQNSYNTHPSGYMNYGYQHYTHPTFSQSQQQYPFMGVDSKVYTDCFATTNSSFCKHTNEQARAAAEQAAKIAAEQAARAAAEQAAKAAAEQARSFAAQQARQARAAAEQAAEQAKNFAAEQARQAKAAAEQARSFTAEQARQARAAAEQAAEQARATAEQARKAAAEQAESAKFFAFSNVSSPTPTPQGPANVPSPPLSEHTQEKPSANYFVMSNSTPSGTTNVSNMRNEESSNSGSFKGILPLNVATVPENIVSGAVNVASSAINTARSVLNMFNPEPGTWVNGHWIPTNPESRRERALRILSEMGFYDRDYNATLLARYNDDVARVISELVQ